MFRWTALLSLLAATAAAQPVHHQPLTVGSRAMGVGSAYVAIADDSSAIFHNPGGLPTRSRASITGGLSFQRFDRLVLDDALQRPSGATDLKASPRLAVPNFTAASFRFGERDADGYRPHAIALSVFTRYAEQLRTNGTITDADGLTDQLRIDESFRSQWFGASYATRISSKAQLGASLFLARTTFRHEEILTLLQGNAAGRLEGTQLIAANTIYRQTAGHLVLRVGGLFRRGHWRIGAMLQSPGLRLRGNARVSHQRSEADALTMPGSTRFDFLDERHRARLPIPWEARLGAAHAKGRTTFSMDLGLVGSVWDRHRILEPSEMSLPLEQVAPFLDTSTKRSFVVNLAAGLEVQITDQLAASVGALTDFSSAPRIDEVANVYGSPRIHRFGFTTGVELRYAPVEMMISFAGLFGTGSASAFRGDPANPTDEYLRTDAMSRTFLLQLTGATGTVEAVAERVVDRRRSRHSEAELEPESELESEREPGPESEPESEPELESGSESGSGSESEPEPGSGSESEPESGSEPESEPLPEAECREVVGVPARSC